MRKTNPHDIVNSMEQGGFVSQRDPFLTHNIVKKLVLWGFLSLSHPCGRGEALFFCVIPHF